MYIREEQLDQIWQQYDHNLDSSPSQLKHFFLKIKLTIN